MTFCAALEASDTYRRKSYTFTCLISVCLMSAMDLNWEAAF